VEFGLNIAAKTEALGVLIPIDHKHVVRNNTSEECRPMLLILSQLHSAMNCGRTRFKKLPSHLKSVPLRNLNA